MQEATNKEIKKNQPFCRQGAQTNALSEYPASYDAFERALIKAYKFTQENEDGTIKNVKKYIDIDEAYIKERKLDYIINRRDA